MKSCSKCDSAWCPGNPCESLGLSHAEIGPDAVEVNPVGKWREDGIMRDPKQDEIARLLSELVAANGEVDRLNYEINGLKSEIQRGKHP